MSETRWLVLTVGAPSDALREALTEGLLALGGTSVEEKDAVLITYVRSPDDADAWVDAARVFLSERARLDDVILEWRWQHDEDWTESWKRGLRPRRVGRRFIVTPSWGEPERGDEDLVIVIDPEMAFGTGEHATTRGALRFLEQVIEPGDRVLDVGTGSAILAIGAALLGANDVIGIDNDADAILNARDNIERNGVTAQVRLEHGAVDAEYLAAAGEAHFGVIVANVLSGVLKPLLPAFERSLQPGGYLILGGILEEEADEMLAHAANAGFEIIAEDLEAEWWGVLLQRPKTKGP